MSAVYPQFVDEGNTTICGLHPRSQFVDYSAMTDIAKFLAVGGRLKQIREGFSGLNQAAWAQKHSFGVTQYNNWEKGTRRIPVEAAEKLCDIYGLTLDAIYRGRLDGVSEKALKVF